MLTKTQYYTALTLARDELHKAAVANAAGHEKTMLADWDNLKQHVADIGSQLVELDEDNGRALLVLAYINTSNESDVEALFGYAAWLCDAVLKGA